MAIFDYGNWEYASTDVAVAEGGISKDKDDTGNYFKFKKDKKSTFIGTRYGVTFRWWIENGATAAQKDLTKEEQIKAFNKIDKSAAKELFKKRFWDKYDLRGIKDKEVAANILDAMVNQNFFLDPGSEANNVNEALIALGYDDEVKAAKNHEDIHNLINKAIKEKGAQAFNDEFSDIREERYKKSGTYHKHGEGWLKRINKYRSPHRQVKTDEWTKDVDLNTIRVQPKVKLEGVKGDYKTTLFDRESENQYVVSVEFNDDNTYKTVIYDEHGNKLEEDSKEYKSIKSEVVDKQLSGDNTFRKEGEVYNSKEAGDEEGGYGRYQLYDKPMVEYNPDNESDEKYTIHIDKSKNDFINENVDSHIRRNKTGAKIEVGEAKLTGTPKEEKEKVSYEYESWDEVDKDVVGNKIFTVDGKAYKYNPEGMGDGAYNPYNVKKGEYKDVTDVGMVHPDSVGVQRQKILEEEKLAEKEKGDKALEEAERLLEEEEENLDIGSQEEETWFDSLIKEESSLVDADEDGVPDYLQVETKLEKPVKPKFKDYDTGAAYMEARKKYKEDLKAWEDQQAQEEPTEEIKTDKKITSVARKKLNKAIENGILTQEDVDALKGTGRGGTINRKDADKLISKKESIYKNETLKTASEFYNVPKKDMRYNNKTKKWLPKVGAKDVNGNEWNGDAFVVTEESKDTEANKDKNVGDVVVQSEPILPADVVTGEVIEKDMPKTYSIGDVIEPGDYTGFEDNNGNLVRDQKLTITAIDENGNYELQKEDGGLITNISPDNLGVTVETPKPEIGISGADIKPHQASILPGLDIDPNKIVGDIKNVISYLYKKIEEVNNDDSLSSEEKIKRKEGIQSLIQENETLQNDGVAERNGNAQGDGWSYWGDLDENGKPHGKGKFTWESGLVYEGDFKNGKQDGQGTTTMPNGHVIYTGGYKNGEMHGYGKKTNVDGSSYNGDFINGKKYGYGVSTDKDGNVTKGNWINGVGHTDSIDYYNNRVVTIDGEEWIINPSFFYEGGEKTEGQRNTMVKKSTYDQWLKSGEEGNRDGRILNEGKVYMDESMNEDTFLSKVKTGEVTYNPNNDYNAIQVYKQQTKDGVSEDDRIILSYDQKRQYDLESELERWDNLPYTLKEAEMGEGFNELPAEAKQLQLDQHRQGIILRHHQEKGTEQDEANRKAYNENAQKRRDKQQETINIKQAKYGDPDPLGTGIYTDAEGNIYQKSEAGNWRVKYNKAANERGAPTINEWGEPSYELTYDYDGEWTMLEEGENPNEAALSLYGGDIGDLLAKDTTTDTTEDAPLPKGVLEKVGDFGGGLLESAGGVLDAIGGPSAIISYIMGKKGLEAAMKEVKPQAMPELSPMFMEHIRQSRELAKKGFHPTEERKIKNQIDNAYRVGLDNAVRGTAGDRAKFLAHSGLLDAQRSSALLEVAAQDVALQRENQSKYTELMMFKENFDMQRTEQQRTEDMQMQLAEKQSAAQFTSAAFSTLMNSLGGSNTALLGQYFKNVLSGNAGTTNLYNINK